MFEIDKKILFNVNSLNSKLNNKNLNLLETIKMNLSIFNKSNKRMDLLYKSLCDKMK